MDTGSGSILVVSFGNSAAYHNLLWVSFHLLGAYEETNSRYLTWLFDVDYLEYFWAFLEKLTGFRRPYYISDEIDIRHQSMGIDPLVTGYRIIVTVVVASFGMTKSALLLMRWPCLKQNKNNGARSLRVRVREGCESGSKKERGDGGRLRGCVEVRRSNGNEMRARARRKAKGKRCLIVTYYGTV